ncbi:MAG: ferritin-like domain-containing protein [Chitinophagaceae bacterium]|nr:MAG: ferritin-like domain-containing protein [Chitinophagaceae bacterium]
MPTKNPKATSPSATTTGPANGNLSNQQYSTLLPPLISKPEELFLSELRDTYWAEKHLLVALPKMIDAAGDAALQTALSNHLTETATHVTRLEDIFSSLGAEAVPKKCAALEGLAISGENVIQSTLPGSEVRDNGIISSGIKVENFEIVTYQGLIRQANELGYSEAGNLLQETLNEEIAASELLNSLATKSTTTK